MKISVLGTRGFPKIQGGVEKHCESLYPLFNAKYQITVYRRKPYVNSDKTYPNIKFIDLPSTKIKGFEAVFHSFLATLSACFGKSDVVHIHNIGPALFAPLLRLSGGSKVRYAIAGHMGKRFVAASDFFICDKITSNVFDMQEKNGEITLNCCSNSAIFILPR